MMSMRVAASPRSPLGTPKKNNKDKSLASLLRMHELGILSKKEVREIVLKNRLKSAMSPTSEVPSAPSASPTVNVPSAPKKRKTQGEVPKSKRNPVETTTVDLRNIAKNTTRRRFFNECLQTKSPLWTLTPGGKQVLERLLFERACKDVLDLLYEENPGPLRSVNQQTVKTIIH